MKSPDMIGVWGMSGNRTGAAAATGSGLLGAPSLPEPKPPGIFSRFSARLGGAQLLPSGHPKPVVRSPK